MAQNRDSPLDEQSEALDNSDPCPYRIIPRVKTEERACEPLKARGETYKTLFYPAHARFFTEEILPNSSLGNAGAFRRKPQRSFKRHGPKAGNEKANYTEEEDLEDDVFANNPGEYRIMPRVETDEKIHKDLKARKKAFKTRTFIVHSPILMKKKQHNSTVFDTEAGSSRRRVPETRDEKTTDKPHVMEAQGADGTMGTSGTVVYVPQEQQQRHQQELPCEERALNEQLNAVAGERTNRNLDTRMVEREAEVTERETVVTEREAEVTERETVVTEREAEVTERETVVAEREAEVTERETRLAKREANVAKRDDKIASRETTVAERETTVSEQQITVSESLSPLTL